MPARRWDACAAVSRLAAEKFAIASNVFSFICVVVAFVENANRAMLRQVLAKERKEQQIRQQVESMRSFCLLLIRHLL
jgi:heme exporter protein D